MRVVADHEVCVGAGQCALHVPEVFDQDDYDGTVVVRRAEPEAGQRDAVLEAVRLCPSGAIRIVP